MIIGHFATNKTNGTFIGHIRTLFFSTAKVVLEPVPDAAGKSPSHRIYTGDEVELGAAWRREAKADGAVYYDVKLDDPTFAAPIYARLVQSKVQGTGWILLWERQSKKPQDELAAA